MGTGVGVGLGTVGEGPLEKTTGPRPGRREAPPRPTEVVDAPSSLAPALGVVRPGPVDDVEVVTDEP